MVKCGLCSFDVNFQRNYQSSWKPQQTILNELNTSYKSNELTMMKGGSIQFSSIKVTIGSTLMSFQTFSRTLSFLALNLLRNPNHWKTIASTAPYDTVCTSDNKPSSNFMYSSIYCMIFCCLQTVTFSTPQKRDA